MHAGMSDASRGTLHVILPSNGEEAFKLSEDAFENLKTAGRLATQLMASPACKMHSITDKGTVEPKVAVSAIIAQVLNLKDQLIGAGRPATLLVLTTDIESL